MLYNWQWVFRDFLGSLEVANERLHLFYSLLEGRDTSSLLLPLTGQVNYGSAILNFGYFYVKRIDRLTHS